MLRLLVCLLLSTRYSAAIEEKNASCSACLSYDPARKDEFYQAWKAPSNILKIPKFNGTGTCQALLDNLATESIQKVELLKNSKEFQEIVADLHANGEDSKASISSKFNKPLESGLQATSQNNASLYIFVSFSMGEKALLNLAYEAKQFGATLVLRGFQDGSYLKTAEALQKIIAKTDQGVLIDSELFMLFNVTVVPTYVLAKPFQIYAQERIQTPIHDKLQGHVSLRYALEQFAKEGDLETEAQKLLSGGATL